MQRGTRYKASDLVSFPEDLDLGQMVKLGTHVLVQDAIFVLVTFSGVFDCLSPVLRLLVFALLRNVDISSF